MTTYPTSDIALAPIPSLLWELSKPAIQSGGSLWAKLTIASPEPQGSTQAKPRKGFACAFSVDCSGSMSNAAGAGDKGLGFLQGPGDSKMERAKAALLEALDLLGPQDMAALTAFSSQAVTLFPLTAMTAEGKEQLRSRVAKLSAGGGTALHDGWAQAGKEAAKGLDQGLTCRVILITDGEATDGERNPEELARRSATLASLGVSSSCFGVGASFNEDLLCSMAEAGDGNFRYIPDALMASAAVIAELNGLSSQIGRKARLVLTAGDGVTSIVNLNDLTANPDGSLALANLVAGRPIEVLAQIQLAPGFEGAARFKAELFWESRDGLERQLASSGLATALAAGESESADENSEVAGLRATLLAAKEKANMVHALAKGDLSSASASMANARSILNAAPAGYSGFLRESSSMDSLEATFASGDTAKTRKSALWQSYASTKNQSVDQPPPETDKK